MINCTCDKNQEEKKKWFIYNDKLVIVRQNDEHQGHIIGAFHDDITAFEEIEKQMEYEGKFMTILELPWMEFRGYLNTKNNTYKHKIVKSVCYRDKNGSINSEVCFWFQVVENNCLL